jgi:hypothetical protein
VHIRARTCKVTFSSLPIQLNIEELTVWKFLKLIKFSNLTLKKQAAFYQFKRFDLPFISD